MSDSTSLSGLGDITKPATVLIEKISDAIGGVFKPYQIVRVAKAEAEADRIQAEGNIAIADIHRRAFHRFLHEEAKKQTNIEDITRKALPKLQSDAEPAQIENDWITNFFDKCRLTSDDQLQEVWSRVLAGEANSPGRFARRTVNFLASLDKPEAEQFTALCSLCWSISTEDGYVVPLIFDVKNKIYIDSNVGFSTISHLASIGLAQFEPLAGFVQRGLDSLTTLYYFGREVELLLPTKESDNTLDLGKVLLTRMGLELAPICQPVQNAAFFRYVIEKWRAEGVLLKGPSMFQIDDASEGGARAPTADEPV